MSIRLLAKVTVKWPLVFLIATSPLGLTIAAAPTSIASIVISVVGCFVLGAITFEIACRAAAQVYGFKNPRLLLSWINRAIISDGKYWRQLEKTIEEKQLPIRWAAKYVTVRRSFSFGVRDAIRVFVPQQPLVAMFISYAMMVYIFSAWYAVMSKLDPRSFNTGQELAIIDAVYFSVVTAATVGYGDISPASAVARMFVVVQITSSLLYTVLIFGGAAAYLSEMRERDRDGRD